MKQDSVDMPMVTIGYICEVKGGFAFKSREYQNEGIPLIRISNIVGKKISLNGCVYVDPKYESEAEEYILKKGDILIALSGATTGKYGIYDLDTKAFLNQRIGRIHFGNTDRVTPLFVFYYLEIIKKDILKEAYGAAQPNISPKKLAEFPIPLPPLPTQHRIVEKIEELFSELDSGVGSLKKAKEQIGLYKQSVLRAAFSGELVKREKANVKRHRAESRGRQTEVLKAAEPGGEYEVDGLPVGWKWVKLEDISEKIHYGYTAKSSENFNGPKYLRITDIQEGKVDWKKVPHCNIEDDQIGKYKLNNGDIVFARTGATVGKSFLIKSIPYESVFASYLIRVIPSDEVLNEYIYYFFQSNKYWEQIKRGQVGIGQPNFNGKKLSQINIPIPPLDQQHQIVAEIERRFSEAENLEKSIDEGLAKAEALRQSILKQAFEGRLVS